MTATPQTVAVTENSNAIALGLLGDEWNLTIVKLAIMSGVSRYKDFRDTLGIANSVLTVRLRRLTEAGVFTTRQYSDAPRRYEHVLTECGRELWQVLLTIWSREATWVTEHIEPLPPMYHRARNDHPPHLPRRPRPDLYEFILVRDLSLCLVQGNPTFERIRYRHATFPCITLRVRSHQNGRGCSLE
jgi:DNA-binding HxlR family transcriptional regulator